MVHRFIYQQALWHRDFARVLQLEHMFNYVLAPTIAKPRSPWLMLNAKPHFISIWLAYFPINDHKCVYIYVYTKYLKAKKGTCSMAPGLERLKQLPAAPSLPFLPLRIKVLIVSISPIHHSPGAVGTPQFGIAQLVYNSKQVHGGYTPT